VLFDTCFKEPTIGSFFVKEGTRKSLVINHTIFFFWLVVPDVFIWHHKWNQMNTKLKSAEHLEEVELNKLLKYLYQNELWVYYLVVRLGVSSALRYSDLSRIRWSDVIDKRTLIIKEQKTGKVREIPLQPELSDTLNKVFVKMGCPDKTGVIIPLHIRTINKQIKIHAVRSGVRGKRISTHSWRKSFGREVWRRNNFSEGSLVKLSQLFNHSSVGITRIYLDITREEVNDLYNLQDLFVY
jgi:integrase